MTHQAMLEKLRESERIRLETAREAAKNTLRVTPGGIATAIDLSGRTVAVKLDIHQLLRLNLEIETAIANAVKDDELAPETKRGA